MSIDAPEQNAALIQKLDLPFPILSDPDRSGAITPYELADPADKRNIARPAVVLLAAGGDEVFRQVSRDFADRVTEDDVVGRVRELGLSSTSQDPPKLGPAEPGPNAMPFEALLPYYQGARFAVLAMSRRHPETADDATAYMAEMDRYQEDVRALFRRRRDAAGEGT